MKLREQISKLTENLNYLSSLVIRLDERMPEDLADIAIDRETARISINVGYSHSDRERVLSLIGEMFGTDGWTKTPSWDKEFYVWNKMVDNVDVRIPRAEMVPTLEACAVQPTEFPVLLRDREEVA